MLRCTKQIDDCVIYIIISRAVVTVFIKSFFILGRRTVISALFQHLEIVWLCIRRQGGGGIVWHFSRCITGK